MKKLPLIAMMLSLAGCGGNNAADTQLASTSVVSNNPADVAMEEDAESIAEAAAASTDSRQYLVMAYRDGLSEIQLGQLALQRSTNGDVRDFAQRMIDDHTRINASITGIAQTKTIALPSDVSTSQKNRANRLSALSGDAFDRAYMAANVAAHDRDVATTKKQAQQGSDADIKFLAEVTAPILDVHLGIAEEINSVLDPSAFLSAIYQDGLAENQLSQIALQRATRADVKEYAQKMIDDHNRVNSQIVPLAQQRNLTLPTTLTPTQQVISAVISNLSGADFEKAYMENNIVVHLKDLRRTAQQAKQGSDNDVRVFALKTTPIIADHLARAIDIDRHISPSPLYSVYQDSLAEIQLANLALLRSTNEQVRSYAQRMITDHIPVNAQISQLAQQKNVALPTQVSPEQLQNFVELLAKSGADFDRAYIEVNVKEHDKAVTELSAEAQTASDGDIRQFFQTVVPTLSQHLALARAIQQQLGGATQH